jgi:hypothetical protein
MKQMVRRSDFIDLDVGSEKQLCSMDEQLKQTKGKEGRSFLLMHWLS